MTHYFAAQAIQLSFIVIHQTYQPVQSVMRRKLRTLPYLALVTLAISQYDKHMIVPSVKPVRVSNADRRRDTLPERAGRHVYSWGLEAVCVRGEIRMRLVQCVDILQRKKTFQS